MPIRPRYNPHVSPGLLLAAADKYRREGMSVIPIVAGRKVPDGRALAASGSYIFPRRISWWPYTRRVPRDEEIQAWFGADACNLAFVTGYRRLLVLDFDDREYFERWAQQHGSWAARTSIQKSARGFHVLFRWRGTWTVPLYSTAKFQLLSGRGVAVGELKGARDWVVAWPSVHPSGQKYEWLPGQAPWERDIPGIQSLSEIGVEPFRGLVGGYLRLVPKIVSHPRQQIPAFVQKLGNKYRSLRGVRDVFFRK